jgi:hypothetical protein
MGAENCKRFCDKLVCSKLNCFKEQRKPAGAGFFNSRVCPEFILGINEIEA